MGEIGDAVVVLMVTSDVEICRWFGVSSKV